MYDTYLESSWPRDVNLLKRCWLQKQSDLDSWHAIFSHFENCLTNELCDRYLKSSWSEEYEFASLSYRITDTHVLSSYCLRINNNSVCIAISQFFFYPIHNSELKMLPYFPKLQMSWFGKPGRRSRRGSNFQRRQSAPSYYSTPSTSISLPPDIVTSNQSSLDDSIAADELDSEIYFGSLRGNIVGIRYYKGSVCLLTFDVPVY